jgi:hypothetical protein
MSNIKLYSGGYINLLSPQPEDIHLIDIAHGLSNLCRFTGHTARFYSVAQHSVLVSLLIEDPALRLVALLHDAAEAYLGDVSSPLKRLLPEYQCIERRFEEVIAERFGFSYGHLAKVKRADFRALATEKRDLMASHPLDAQEWEILKDGKIKPYHQIIDAMLPEMAHNQLIGRYAQVRSDEAAHEIAHRQIPCSVISIRP